MGENKDDILLSVKDLNVFYGGIQALHGISLTIKRGEIVSMIGANGAGKSTLLKTIAGDKEIGSGTITFEGRPLPGAIHQFSRQGICLVPEGRKIFVNLTVMDNLKAGAYAEKKKQVIQERMEEVFDLFPRLKERCKQMSGTLSGGEQQMLAVGRAMMAAPKLMMLDEPSLGLAPIIIDEMFEKFKQINKAYGTTMLIVEQNAQLALETADTGYILNLGKIQMEGKGSDLLDNPYIQEAYLGFK
ncbi:MAG: ABC transporter ATP-binding protein [Lachnospiraceae bacterium]|nr:ABC transporter ATP-binding protein [Lachnospiraceae bacterium]